MALHVSDFPAEMTTRRRTVQFKTDDLLRILADHCRAQGIEISDDCKLNVWGVEHDHGRDSVTHCIDGD